MLTVLVVGDQTAARAESQSSLEVMHARDAEEAVEKLARNRRIDAVLVLPPEDAARTVEAIREEILAPPPIFLPAGTPQIEGTRRLPEGETAMLPALVAQALEGAGA